MNQTNINIHVLCYGGGINSVALLIEATKRGIIFDAILFADPGSEKQKSYEYTKMMNEWCIKNGQPEITTVKQVTTVGEFIGLYNDCLSHETLPSIAFGFKTCSQKFKKFPQEKFINNWFIAQIAWEKGNKVIKYIGYDADEEHRTNKEFSDDKYELCYPLVDWNWGRFECVKRITDEGLHLPPKSSCTFCPSSKPNEIIELYNTNKHAFYEAVKMERVAKPNLTNVKGLGRNYSWWDLIVAYKYLNILNKYKVTSTSIPIPIQKLIKKIKNIKSVDYSKSVPSINDLFSNSIQIACECYDG